MRTRFLPATSLLVLIGLLFCPCHVQAQAAGQGAGARLSFLSAQDRLHYLKVRHQVLESQPDLKTEQESLEKEWQFVKGKGTGATAEDRETLRNNFMAHNEKMEAAMLQADPSISSVLDQIKAQWKERFQQHSGTGDDSST